MNELDLLREQLNLELERIVWQNNYARAVNIAKFEAAKRLLEIVNNNENIMIPDSLAEAYIDGFVENDNVISMMHSEGYDLDVRVKNLNLKFMELENG